MPRISVIIPHFNQPEHLRRCLMALAPQLVDADGARTEVLVIDNGSEQLPLDVLSGYPFARLLEERLSGPGPARNRGVREATGDVLAFIDADCVADAGWLNAIRAHAAAHMDILGGDVRILHVDPDHPTVWEAYESEFAYRMEHYIRSKGFTGTGNLVIRRPVMDDVGEFAGIGVAEDRDWGRRAGEKGYGITWAPDMVAYHPARESFAELARKWDRQIAHDLEDRLSSGDSWRLRWIVRAVALPVSPLAMIPRILKSDRINGGLLGRIKAFGGLVAIRSYRGLVMLRLVVRPGVGTAGDHWRAQ